MAVFMTTLDNPYDYFTQFDEWYAFDVEKGYNTCSYLARVALTSSEMSEKNYEEAVENAVDDAVRLNITGNYKKIYSKDEDKESNDEEETEDEFDEDTIESLKD